ncbi:hypothetical protein [Sansalvadorimonas verongulae]|uniref:hypothetical protein n=1 Tax=Sansalvadorimonas verongulae TaxID=2172824 RepID=UPI0012BB8601|nr:hypothetical protein [Sansalvadorimonas verongulae]MTI14513.1 hypothetical protein [Sansalvadorimonas verongulae]
MQGLKSKMCIGSAAFKATSKAARTAPTVVALAVSLGGMQLRADEQVQSSDYWTASSWEQSEFENDEQDDAQQNPLVFNARLFSGPANIALEFTIDPWKQAPESSAEISELSSGLRYRYDLIPEMETLPFISHVNLVSKADTVNVVRGSTSYNNSGQLEEFTLPSGFHTGQSGHLVGAVSKAMGVLSALKPDVLALLDNDSTALAVSGSTGIVFTIYGSEEPVQPLVEVVVPAQGEATVKVLAKELEVRLPSENPSGTKDSPRSLNVIGLMVNHKGAIPRAVVRYLKKLVSSVEYRGLRSNFLKLGVAGQASWQVLDEYKRRIAEDVLCGRWVNNPSNHVGELYDGSMYTCIHKYSGIHDRYDIILTDIDDAAKAMTSIHNAYNTIKSGKTERSGLYQWNMNQAHFVVRSKLLSKMYRHGVGQYDYVIDSINNAHSSWGYTSAMNAKQALNRVVVTEDNVGNQRLHFSMQPRGDSVKEYLRANTKAFMAGAVVSGTISTGVRIYDRYRQDGKLPYQYSSAELMELSKHSVVDGLRGGISGTATMNLMKFTGVPAPVAGAAVAVANSLYNAYQVGEMSWRTAAPLTLRAGAESVVAVTGGWAGEVVSKMLPYGQTMPMKVGGALAGSLVGHYTYQLAVDHCSSYLPEAMSGKPKNTVLKLR